MKITLQTVLGLRQAIGQGETEIELAEGSTVADLVASMKQRWGDRLSSHFIDPVSGSVLPHMRIMVNGRTIAFLKGMDTPLAEGDEVLIVPLASGG